MTTFDRVILYTTFGYMLSLFASTVAYNMGWLKLLAELAAK